VAQGIAAALPAAPAEVETGQLPQAVQAQTARHDRIAGKVALEKPKVGRDVELCHHMAFAVQARVAADVGDAVHHQHGRLGQLRVARAEQLAARAFEKVIAIEAARKVGHVRGSPDRYL
jgi:hypothetical protein